VYSHTVIQVQDYLQFLPEFGSFGVDIFFVISGFIMVWISKPTDTPLHFIWNRIRRVVPLYWFFTLLMAIILLLLPSVFKNTVFDLSALMRSLAFLPGYSVAYSDQVWPIVAPGWSLNYEMYFYLIFALSLLVASRFRILFISAVILGVFLLANSLNNKSAMQLFYSESIVFEFIFGMLLAVAWKRGLRLPASTGLWLILLGFSLLFLQLPASRIIEFGLPSLLVVTGCLYAQATEVRWAVVLGDASYALYLSHIFSLGVLRKALPPLLGDGPVAAWIFVVISLIVCTAISVVVHFGIDNWLLRRERFEPFRNLTRSSARHEA
jgi:exopolysaccharide production protein ExoZ